jgi:hypothetical protein
MQEAREEAPLAQPTQPNRPTQPTQSDHTELKRYLDDLSTIKDLMIRSEEQPLVHHWVFAVWGVLVIVGSVLTGRLLQSPVAGGVDPLVIVWMPLLLVGSIAEAVGAILKSRETGIPVVTRRRMRLYLATAGVLVLLGITIVHLNSVGFTTAILIAMGALPLLVYAEATYTDLFIPAYSLLAIAVIAALLGDVVQTLNVRVAGGVFVGFVYLVSGFLSWNLEKSSGRRTGRRAGDTGTGAPRSNSTTDPTGPSSQPGQA